MAQMHHDHAQARAPEQQGTIDVLRVGLASDAAGFCRQRWELQSEATGYHRCNLDLHCESGRLYVGFDVEIRSPIK